MQLQRSVDVSPLPPSHEVVLLRVYIELYSEVEAHSNHDTGSDHTIQKIYKLVLP